MDFYVDVRFEFYEDFIRADRDFFEQLLVITLIYVSYVNYKLQKKNFCVVIKSSF